MKYYITHYTPLQTRKTNLLAQLKRCNITDYEFIEVFDREDLKEEEINKFKNVTLSEISLFLKHIEIFKKENEEIIIVLEDDVIFNHDFINKLNNYLDNLPNSWDILFTCECSNLRSPDITSDKIYYESETSRGTCMYILNKGVSRKLLDIFNNEQETSYAIDWWLNKIKDENNLIYYWSEPTIAIQGSELGIYPSSITR
jgi:GR25 family glycosyltransferase involved in LPS biosynthesis